MFIYLRKVNYYETDQMGITHHSNYVRWMEEARMAMLKDAGFGIKKFEDDGITSPVLSVECNYKHTTTFDDNIKIEVTLTGYTGVKLFMSYKMINADTDTLVFTANSSHCFVDMQGVPIAIKKRYPQFDELLRKEVESC